MALTIDNRSEEAARLGFFVQPVVNPALDAVIWRVVDLAPGEVVALDLARALTLVARYGGDRAHPEHVDRETETVPIAAVGTRCVIETDAACEAPSLRTDTIEEAGDEPSIEVRNQHDRGVRLDICHDGLPVFAPIVLWPGAIFREHPWPPMYALVLDPLAEQGGLITLDDEAMPCVITSYTRRLTITGGRWEGFVLTAADDET